PIGRRSARQLPNGSNREVHPARRENIPGSGRGDIRTPGEDEESGVRMFASRIAATHLCTGGIEEGDYGLRHYNFRLAPQTLSHSTLLGAIRQPWQYRRKQNIEPNRMRSSHLVRPRRPQRRDTHSAARSGLEATANLLGAVGMPRSFIFAFRKT